MSFKPISLARRRPRVVARRDGSVRRRVTFGDFPDITGDPSVLPDGAMTRLYYTRADTRDPDPVNWAASIGGAVLAPSGVTGTRYSNLVLTGDHNSWDYYVETAEVVKIGSTRMLYYSGYGMEGWPATPGRIGLATSADGERFARVGPNPVVPLTDLDENGAYSPSVFFFGSEIGMIYTGHSYVTDPGIRLLGATSLDGISWVKNPVPVLEASAQPTWMRDGAAECDVLVSNGTYYLFFTGLLDDQRVIGVARSLSPFSGYAIRPTPLLSPLPGTFDALSVLAPTTLLAGNVLRCWYSTNDDPNEVYHIGYTEFDWPLAWV